MQRQWRAAFQEFQEASVELARTLGPDAAARMLPFAGGASRPGSSARAAIERFTRAGARLVELLSTHRTELATLVERQLVQEASAMLDKLVEAGVLSREQAEALKNDAAGIARWARDTALRILSFLETAHRQRLTYVFGAGLNLQAGIGVTGGAGLYVEQNALRIPTEVGVTWGGGGSFGINAEASASEFLQMYWTGADSLEGKAFTLTIGGGEGLGIDFQVIFSVGDEPPPVPVGIGISASAELALPLEVSGAFTWGDRHPVYDLDGQD